MDIEKQVNFSSALTFTVIPSITASRYLQSFDLHTVLQFLRVYDEQNSHPPPSNYTFSFTVQNNVFRDKFLHQQYNLQSSNKGEEVKWKASEKVRDLKR